MLGRPGDQDRERAPAAEPAGGVAEPDAGYEEDDIPF
jgi:hypothetical protein